MSRHSARSAGTIPGGIITYSMVTASILHMAQAGHMIMHMLMCMHMHIQMAACACVRVW